MNMIEFHKKKKVYFVQRIAKIYHYFKPRQSSFLKLHSKIVIIITIRNRLPNIKMK